MALAGITKRGLASIAILVAVLWTCLVAERVTVRNAQLTTYRALRTLNHLRMERTIEPASDHAPRPISSRPVVG